MHHKSIKKWEKCDRKKNLGLKSLSGGKKHRSNNQVKENAQQDKNQRKYR